MILNVQGNISCPLPKISPHCAGKKIYRPTKPGMTPAWPATFVCYHLGLTASNHTLASWALTLPSSWPTQALEHAVPALWNIFPRLINTCNIARRLPEDRNQGCGPSITHHVAHHAPY